MKLAYYILSLALCYSLMLLYTRDLSNDIEIYFISVLEGIILEHVQKEIQQLLTTESSFDAVKSLIPFDIWSRHDADTIYNKQFIVNSPIYSSTQRRDDQICDVSTDLIDIVCLPEDEVSRFLHRVHNTIF